MSFFCLEDDLVHQVAGGRHIKQAMLHVPKEGELVFEIRWPDTGEVAAFQCQTEAEFASWIAAVKGAKTGAASMNFGQHLQHLRAKRSEPKPMAPTSSRTPVFQDTLFVLKDGGDRNSGGDWMEYEMRMAKNGSLQYWDPINSMDVTVWTPRDLRSAALKKTAEKTPTAKPWSFQLVVEGSNNAPLELATANKNSRDAWIREIRARQQGLGALSPLREHSVDHNVNRLGMEFQSGPPDPVVVSIVKPGMWAQNEHISPGDEVVELNGIAVKDMSFNEFTSELQQRPLRISFAVKQEDLAKGARFSKSGTVKAKSSKAVPKKRLKDKRPVPAG